VSRFKRAAAELIGVGDQENAPHLETIYLAVGLTTLATWLVIGLNQWAFFANPADTTVVISDLRRFELAISVVGWVLLAVGPAAIVWAFSAGDRVVLRLLPVAALLWPASVIAIQLTLRVQYGEWYVGYYQDRPWFLITDLFAPIFYLMVSRKLRQVAVEELAELS
jgi:hypothetical protein